MLHHDVDIYVAWIANEGRPSYDGGFQYQAILFFCKPACIKEGGVPPIFKSENICQKLT